MTDVRVGLDGNPHSVSDYATLGSTSTVFNANFRFDTWLLPFLNVYALVGYVHNESATDIHVEIPRPGSLPGDHRGRHTRWIPVSTATSVASA